MYEIGRFVRDAILSVDLLETVAMSLISSGYQAIRYATRFTIESYFSHTNSAP